MARRVVVGTESEAVRLGSRRMKPEHLIASLVAMEGVASKALVGAGLEPARFEQLVNPKAVHKTPGPGTKRIKMDRAVKDILADAFRHSLSMQHDFISDRHILLGLLGRGGRPVKLLGAAGAAEADIEIRLAGIPVTETEAERASLPGQGPNIHE